MTDAPNGPLAKPLALWALLIEYDGAGFHGWQLQDGPTTVQAVLERAAARLTSGIRHNSIAAGRTDAGVHATGQVAMLPLPARYGANEVRGALNIHMLPHPVAVLAAAPAAPGWNPRFSATGRAYEYRILTRPARPTLARGRVWHIHHPLDLSAMQQAARYLVGHHDFTSFRATACQAKSPVRTLERLDVTCTGDIILIEAEARSFLHHQVRNMVGTLKLVGEGRWPPARVADALAARSRAAAGPTAPPDGLTLTAVRYPTDPFGPPGLTPATPRPSPPQATAEPTAA